MKHTQQIVFDFDGTIVDSHGNFGILIEQFSTLHGLPYDIAKMGAGYTNPKEKDLGWNMALEAQPAKYDEMLEFYYNKLTMEKKLVPDVFPGIKEVIAELSGNYDLSIITAGHRLTTQAILKHHGLEGYFPVMRTLECAKEGSYPIKPAPESLHCLLRQTNHELRDIVVVGDTPNDIGMANAADAKSIAVKWGRCDIEKLKASNPTLMIDNVGDLPKAIAQAFRL